MDVVKNMPVETFLIGLMLMAVLTVFLTLKVRSKSQKINLLELQLRADKKELERKADEAERQKFAVEERFRAVIDIDQEVQRLERIRHEKANSIAQLRADYGQKKQIYDRLKSELAVYDERLSLAELGIYEPHFELQDSKAYKESITDVRTRQKAMVSRKVAVTCPTEWTVDGSVSKGRTMVGRNIRLVLRAFNNECEAAIANTRWNNIVAMEKRIGNARKQIDKLNETNNITIEQTYFDLKIRELKLTHQYREKLKHEKEERAEASRLVREEAKLLKDAAAAQKAEDEYEKLLDKARKEAGMATSSEIEKANQRVLKLEAELEEAKERNERAKAMAEKTRSGYVYIISNIGSFGEGIIKIGMTRRLEPYDRVKELGDASVPFVFDTHAMIYSDDAPALEKSLHAEYEDRRVNAANYRKEFFKATVEEVEQAVLRLAPNADFFTDIEAQEFHETIAMRKEEEKILDAQEASEFPSEI